MKKLALAGITSILLFTQVYAADTQQLKTDTDKFSYILGYSTGKTFKAQNIQVNSALMMQGLQDGLNGAKPLLTEKQQKDFIERYQKDMAAKAKEKLTAEAAQNEAAGAKFLADNAKQSGVKTTASGLQYKVLTAGKGNNPKVSDTVTVDYEGQLINGTVFDSSYKRGQPATFQLNQVIPGWTEALQMMQPGATWMLYIPAKLAYGDKSVAGVIPPGSTLVFKVHLISVKK